ncbi:MAG: type III pantothenate kinase [Desulfovibrionales bacterium]
MGSELTILADIGNTNTKYGIADRDRILGTFSLPTDLRATGDSIGLSILQMLGSLNLDPETVADWVVSSVVPQLDPLYRFAAGKYGNCNAHFIPADIPVSLENRYQNPAEVGADRLVTAYAARKLYTTPGLIIIDFGTATTFECVQDNAYLGGLIGPGMLSSMQALSTKTAKLPRIGFEPTKPRLNIGRNTAESLRQGFVFGFAAMVEGLCHRLRQQLKGPVTVVATGGFAESIQSICDCLDAVRPDLLLQGLHAAYTVYRQQQGDQK